MNLDVADTGDRRTSGLAAGLVGVTVRRRNSQVTLRHPTNRDQLPQTGSELRLLCEKHNDERVAQFDPLFLFPLYSEIAVNCAFAKVP